MKDEIPSDRGTVHGCADSNPASMLQPERDRLRDKYQVCASLQSFFWLASTRSVHHLTSSRHHQIRRRRQVAASFSQIRQIRTGKSGVRRAILSRSILRCSTSCHGRRRSFLNQHSQVDLPDLLGSNYQAAVGISYPGRFVAAMNNAIVPLKPSISVNLTGLRGLLTLISLPPLRSCLTTNSVNFINEHNTEHLPSCSNRTQDAPTEHLDKLRAEIEEEHQHQLRHRWRFTSSRGCALPLEILGTCKSRSSVFKV